MNSRRNFIEKTLLLAPAIVFPKIIFGSLNPNLPNVLIIGDSISIGYTPFVKDLLKFKANVFRPMLDENKPENCEGTSKGIKNIERWLTKTGVGKSSFQWDVIHFNFGLHDLKNVDPVTGKNSKNPNDPQQADLKQYKKNLEKIVEKLKATGAKLIFATTTPYPDKTNGPLRKPGMSAKYNKKAIKIMNKNGIEINDLYTFMKPRMNELQLPNNVHFKPEGYKALAEKVVQRINEILQ